VGPSSVLVRIRSSESRRCGRVTLRGGEGRIGVWARITPSANRTTLVRVRVMLTPEMAAWVRAHEQSHGSEMTVA
jgi:hypothetical protein